MLAASLPGRGTLGIESTMMGTSELLSGAEFGVKL